MSEPTSLYEDLTLRVWIEAAFARGGSFVHAIAEAALCADQENYPLMRPLLLKLQEKYPYYSDSRMKVETIPDTTKNVTFRGDDRNETDCST